MFNFIQKLTYTVLALQEKVLRKKLGRNLKRKHSNTISKKVIGQAASLELNSKADKSKIKLENNVKCILKKYDNDPQKLLDFVQRSGTKVYKIPFAKNILKLINCEEGLIAASTGIRSLYLSIVIPLFTGEKVELSLKTEPIFVLNNLAWENYHIIQQFHKWYALKLNLPGLDCESQENLQKFLAPSSDEKIQDLSIDEILGLKDAIARDVESINFIVDLAKATTGSRNALMKITAGGASV